jgi:hypothetical protein
MHPEGLNERFLGKNTQSLALELRSVRSHGPDIGIARAPAKGPISTPGSDQKDQRLNSWDGTYFGKVFREHLDNEGGIGKDHCVRI